MKKMILPVLLTGLFAVSCSKKEEAKAETPQAVEADSAQAQPEEAAKAEAPKKHVGEFSGKLPCADCPGIETKLTLNEDGSFLLDETYLEKKDGQFNAKGSYEVSADGAFVTLKEEGNDKPRVFLVEEDAAYLVEKVGDAKKPEYKLAKK
ncbi:MAG: copper resistance protein NlpE N-terminal domain-containing protein [Flavobacteriaceae bacterium]|nr:copper resistance protein NlpE N-terminal domain-containing protein [Flavobacteriaceae bacterium]